MEKIIMPLAIIAACLILAWLALDTTVDIGLNKIKAEVGYCGMRETQAAAWPPSSEPGATYATQAVACRQMEANSQAQEAAIWQAKIDGLYATATAQAAQP